MRFLVLTQYYPPEIGAPQTRLAALTRHLVASGHEVEVVTAMPNYPTGQIFPDYRRRVVKSETIDGVRVRRTWMLASMGGGLKRVLGYLSFTATCPLGLVRTERPDVVFVESPPLTLGIPAWVWARLRRARLVVNVADLWPDTAIEMGLVKPGIMSKVLLALERWLYRSADVVNVVTEGLRDKLRDVKGVPAGKITFLPNGVDVDQFRPDGGDPQVRARLGLPDGPLLIYTGTLGYVHGLDPVLEAAAIAQRVGVDLPLAFLGAGSERDRLRDMAVALGLERVRFHDPVPLEQIASLLPLATAGLVTVRDIPSAQGIRPSKLFPLMAAGLPILYVGGGEGAEIVRAADCGIVVEHAEPEAIFAAWRNLVDDTVNSRRLGANGRAYVEANMSWASLVAAWLTQLG